DGPMAARRAASLAREALVPAKPGRSFSRRGLPSPPLWESSMPPLTLFSAVLVMGVSPVDSDAVAETPPVAAVAESSLRSASEHIRQLAFDGDAETYFASEGNPDAADHFSLVFDKPVKVKSIVVATGRPDGEDKLE